MILKMAKKSNSYQNIVGGAYSTAIGTNTTTNNTFQVSSTSGDSVITVGPDGYCVINKLALLDDITGNKWEIRISNGEIIVEPIELEDKREHKLNKILKQ